MLKHEGLEELRDAPSTNPAGVVRPEIERLLALDDGALGGRAIRVQTTTNDEHDTRLGELAIRLEELGEHEAPAPPTDDAPGLYVAPTRAARVVGDRGPRRRPRGGDDARARPGRLEGVGDGRADPADATEKLHQQSCTLLVDATRKAASLEGEAPALGVALASSWDVGVRLDPGAPPALKRASFDRWECEGPGGPLEPGRRGTARREALRKAGRAELDTECIGLVLRSAEAKALRDRLD